MHPSLSPMLRAPLTQEHISTRDLNSPAWLAFRREVREAGPVAIEPTLCRLLELIAALVDGCDAFAVLSRKRTDDPGVIDGWMPERVFMLHESKESRELADHWMATPELVRADPMTMTLLEHCGTVRCFLHEDCIGDIPWEEHPSYAFLRMRNCVDRLVGGIPLSERLELFVGVDRGAEGGWFSEEERYQLLRAMELLMPLGRHLALSHSLIEGAQPLSPREREVLGHLLAGITENDIASTTALSVHTVHDYVKRIYKKYGVRSRSELMALWIQPPII